MLTGPEAEAELVARCRAGDQAAFHELVEAHHARVYRTAFAVIGDAHAAAEVEQEAFVKAWQGLPTFRGDATLATWLTRLALNAARDHLRRRRTRALLQGVFQSFHSRRENLFERVEDRDELQRALLRLSPPLRHVVALRYGVELSPREIAEVLGCPEGTVKSRLNAALRKLREMLETERGVGGARPNPWRVLDP
jgi:RNA polymerase sigma-70 factor (ECF subfamily)